MYNLALAMTRFNWIPVYTVDCRV